MIIIDVNHYPYLIASSQYGKTYIALDCLGIINGITMVDKKILVVALGVVFALGTFGPNIAQMIQTAEAHGVQAQLQSRFVRIEDETFNKQSLQTGETLTLQGTLVSLVERDMRAWLSIFSESTNAGNRWEILARDPPGNVFELPGNGVVQYSISAKALEPGVYHVHTQLNVEHVGPGLGPGQTIQVSGPAILKAVPWGNVAFQVILIGAGLGVTFATRPWQVI